MKLGLVMLKMTEIIFSTFMIEVIKLKTNSFARPKLNETNIRCSVIILEPGLPTDTSEGKSFQQAHEVGTTYAFGLNEQQLASTSNHPASELYDSASSDHPGRATHPHIDPHHFSLIVTYGAHPTDITPPVGMLVQP